MRHPSQYPLLNQPTFHADRYRNSRPLYPREIFRLLRGRALPNESTVFLDLACGAGQSTASFLGLGMATRGYAIDPDPAMIEAARTSYADQFPEVTFSEGRAEAIPLPDAAVDLVLIGSAIHWFDLSLAKPEIERVLKPGGTLLVFEYQFPKCLDNPELAETIRRRFNLEWKAPVQRPRGTLADLITPFLKTGGWQELGDDRPKWEESLSLETFLGHLDSQSRYLHAEAAAPDPAQYREAVREFFSSYFSKGPLRFDLKPRAIALGK